MQNDLSDFLPALFLAVFFIFLLTLSVAFFVLRTPATPATPNNAPMSCEEHVAELYARVHELEKKTYLAPE